MERYRIFVHTVLKLIQHIYRFHLRVYVFVKEYTWFAKFHKSYLSWPMLNGTQTTNIYFQYLSGNKTYICFYIRSGAYILDSSKLVSVPAENLHLAVLGQPQYYVHCYSCFPRLCFSYLGSESSFMTGWSFDATEAISKNLRVMNFANEVAPILALLDCWFQIYFVHLDAWIINCFRIDTIRFTTCMVIVANIWFHKANIKGAYFTLGLIFSGIRND